MGGAYQYRDIFARFKTMRRKQNLTSALGIQKKKKKKKERKMGKKRHTLLCILLVFRVIVA